MNEIELSIIVTILLLFRNIEKIISIKCAWESLNWNIRTLIRLVFTSWKSKSQVIQYETMYCLFNNPLDLSSSKILTFVQNIFCIRLKQVLKHVIENKFLASSILCCIQFHTWMPIKCIYVEQNRRFASVGVFECL